MMILMAVVTFIHPMNAYKAYCSQFSINEPITNSSNAVLPSIERPRPPPQSQTQPQAKPDPTTPLLRQLAQQVTFQTNTPVPQTQSRSQTPSATSSNELNGDEKIILFKILCGFKLAYKYRKKKPFWNEIKGIFKKEMKKDHKTLDRVVDRECRAQQKYLEECGTGEEDSEDTLNALIDEWIDIRKEKEETETEVNSLLRDVKKALNSRDNLVRVRHMYAATTVSDQHRNLQPLQRSQGLRPGQTDSLCI
jgi:hypothetical protein